MGKVSFLRLILKVLIVFFISFGMISCTGKKGSGIVNPVLKTGEGFTYVPGGKIWYKVTGIGKGIPVVLLHGGPGSSSFYLKPFEELGNERQVIRYDQLGGGKSTFITDTSMFNIEHFVFELDSLRRAFGISKWNVLGHSWGTILALEYYLKYPDNVASLSFASACFDIPAFTNHARELLKNLPDSLQNAVNNAEKTGNFQDPAYIIASNKFTELYLMRKPVKADADSISATFNGGLYFYMQGPSEFTITGTLKDYNSCKYLKKIKIPTLFTVGEFDEVGPDLVKNFANKVSGSKYVEFPNSAHITIWDATEENIKVVRDFLLSVDTLYQ
jgi:proline iminopeptidase